MDNLVIADGGEKLSAGANVAFIISNVLLSYLFAGVWGIRGVTIFAINVFAVSSFDAVTLVVLIMVEKYLGLLTLFIGLSMAAQPLIGRQRLAFEICVIKNVISPLFLSVLFSVLTGSPA